MTLPSDCRLMRIYVGESETYEGKPVFESIVLKARETGLAGATVLRGPMGYGQSSQLHTAKILRLSADLPVIVEIVETEEKLRGFIATLAPMLEKAGVLVTLERVEVLHHGPK